MAQFVRIETKNGGTQYRNKTENKVVSAKDLEENYPAVKEELDLGDAGQVVDSETVTQGDGDGVVDTTNNEENASDDSTENQSDDEEQEAPENPYRRKTPSSEEGFGFPRKNGKTVDIFDGKTPHTEVRLVSGKMVPLSRENYESKSDAEIHDRLVELELL